MDLATMRAVLLMMMVVVRELDVIQIVEIGVIVVIVKVQLLRG